MGKGLWFMPEMPYLVKFWQNITFLNILKLLLLSWISGNASSYDVQYIVHTPNLDVHSANEKVALAGDFNTQVGEKSFDTFLYQQHELTYISKNPTCYKNPSNPRCIDHILKTSRKSF